MTLKLAVIVSDYGAAANCGGGVQQVSRTFDLSPEAAAYIEQNMKAWHSVSLAIHEEVLAPKEEK